MKKLLLCTLPLLMVMVFAACSKDGKEPVNPGEEDEKTRMENATFTFSVNLPAQANPSPKSNSNDNSIETRAITAQDENEVTEINVLAFLDNAGTFTLADKSEATNIENVASGTDGNKKKFKVKFSKLIKSSRYQFIVIANAKNEVAQLFTTFGITDGAEKNATLALLKLEGVDRWVDAAGASIRNLPMWGESDTETVSENMDISNVRLLRMVAKINVTIDAVTGVRNDFKLEIVDLYNFNKDGRVSPNAANLASGSKSKVVNPTNIGIHTQGPVSYASTSDEALTETIYTFESKVPYLVAPAVDLGDVICLVIGGKYKGSATTRYYRVDLAKKDIVTGKYDYMDVLRNHNYKVNVTKVANSGYDTSLEAFNSRAVNIDVDIEAWDEDDVVVDYDGQYQFGTDKRHLDFFMEGRAQDILVFADHPSGWAVDMATKPGWITITPTSDNSGAPKLMSVSADPLLPTDLDRTGEFYLIAGNLRKKITVKQTTEAELSLEIAPSSISFRKSAPQAKTVVVESFPVNLVRTITVTGDIVWETGFAPTDASGFDWPSFQIKPKVNATANTLSSTITVSVTHNGTVLSKSTTVNQRNTDLNFMVGSKPASYPAAGGEVGFNVTSDAVWQLSVDGQPISDPSGIISLITTAEQPEAPITPIPYRFNLAPNSTYAERAASFYAKSSNADFPEQMVEIKQAPYPLILNPSATTVNLPTNVAQSVNVTVNSGWKIKTGADASVLASTTPATGVVQTGSSNVLNSATNLITLTPSTVVANLGAAGQVVRGSIELESANHPGATAISRTITINRTIQGVWSYASISPANGASLAHTGQNVTVSANTNMAWQVASNVATAVNSPGSGYGTNKALAITIPKNTTWISPRSVVVSAIQAGGALVTRATYSQLGYHIAYSYGIPSTIPGRGASYTLGFMSNTSSSIIQLRAIVNGTSTVVGGLVNVPAIAAANGTVTATIAVGVYTAASSRSIMFQISKNGGSTWENLLASTQYGYDLMYVSGAPASLPAAASNVTLTFKSSLSSPGNTYTARAVNVTAGGALGSAIIPATDSPANVSVTFTVASNDSWSAARQVRFEWYNGSSWVPISTVNQTFYDISFVSTTMESYIQPFGGNYTITVKSTNGCPRVPIGLRDVTKNSTGIPSPGEWSSCYEVASVPPLAAGGTYTFAVPIAAYWGGSTAHWFRKWYFARSGVWDIYANHFLYRHQKGFLP